MKIFNFLKVLTWVILVFVPIYLLSYSIFSPFSCGWSISNSKRIVLVADPQMEGDSRVLHQGWYGQLNNDFNDWYFWLIMRNVYYFMRPDYVFTMGDVFSSQYIDMDEFGHRLSRFNKIFGSNFREPKGSIKLVNLTGNHDVGYGDDLPLYRLSNFERHFGQQNTVRDFAGHKLVTINSLTLDGTRDHSIKQGTWDFLENTAKQLKSDDKVLLFIHVPLHKPKGACYDPPNIIMNHDNSAPIEQTMVSESSSRAVLSKLKPKYIFTGHDHVGCVYKHSQTNTTEYTVRTIMGDHGGNIGLFEFTENSDGTHSYKYKDCRYFETTTIWIYIITALVWTILALITWLIMSIVALFTSSKVKKD
ncbi:hypothetical protein AKO1_015675 [Acrasis kona]|uniref:Calcineurin-like phosphoesterase domain-containing protein n=1 Tax=Acrasis kona TaxID=1008807 RepID=A0AAW2ZIT5_9EUKA